MNQFVIAQASGARETLAAGIADVGFQTQVALLMSQHCRARDKGLVASVALEGFFSCVTSLMIQEVSLISEQLVTVGARPRTDSVDFFMFVKVLLLLELFVTNITAVLVMAFLIEIGDFLKDTLPRVQRL